MNKPEISYVNGVMLVDGKRAPPGFADTSNPYVPQNWLATPEDRGGRTPGASPPVEHTTRPMTSYAPQAIDPQTVQAWMAEAQRRGIPLDQFLTEVNRHMIAAQTNSTGVTPNATQTPSNQAIPYNTGAGAKPKTQPTLTSILPGVTTRSARPRQYS